MLQSVRGKILGLVAGTAVVLTVAAVIQARIVSTTARDSRTGLEEAMTRGSGDVLRQLDGAKATLLEHLRDDGENLTRALAEQSDRQLSQADLVYQGRLVQLLFRGQMLQWKNLMFYGAGPHDREKYLKQFEAERDACLAAATALKDSGRLSAAIQATLEQFLTELEDINTKYRNGYIMAEFGDTWAEGVRGADQAVHPYLDQPDQLIGSVVEQLREEAEAMRGTSGGSNGETTLDSLLRNAETGIQSSFNAVGNELDVLRGELVGRAEEAGKVTDRALSWGMWSTVIVGLGALALGIYLVGKLARSIREAVVLAQAVQEGDCSMRLANRSRDEVGQLTVALNAMADSLEERSKLASAIADGDLDQDVRLASERDALGRALQAMVASLRDILGTVNSTVHAVADGSFDMQSSSEELTEGSQEQGRAVSEVSETVGIIRGQAQANAASAEHLDRLSAEAKQASTAGRSRMDEVVSALDRLQKTGREMSKIIKLIDDIAFQTNLLALNAAVEAARAGRHGRGFAVVAEEVRNLATRSAKAVQDTSALITSNSDCLKQGAGAIAASVKELERIDRRVNEVASLVTGISDASREQSAAVEHVEQAVGRIDSVTRVNTDRAGVVNDTAIGLRDSVLELRRFLERFGGGGQSLTSLAAATATDEDGAVPVHLDPSAAADKAARPAALASGPVAYGDGDGDGDGEELRAFDVEDRAATA